MRDGLADHGCGPRFCYEMKMVGARVRPVNGKSAGQLWYVNNDLLLQLRVLRLGLLQDGDVGVGVFPESEEVLVR
jgi:hypothetical protein